MPPAKEDLDRALKAFKKRLKLTRRDNESSFASRATTGGRVSGIVGVTPPDGFGPEVWAELVRLGKIRRAGGSLYELVPQQNAPGT
jgi:hypothetical protein